MSTINIERFARILAKRWKRNRQYRAADLPELKRLSRYAEGMYPSAKLEACRDIERQARQLFEISNL